MKRLLPILIGLVALLPVSPVTVLAQQPEIAIAAKAYMLSDYQSSQVMASQNAHERVEPASLTKLMTAYIVFSALKQNRIQLDQVVPVSNKATAVMATEAVKVANTCPVVS